MNGSQQLFERNKKTILSNLNAHYDENEYISLKDLLLITLYHVPYLTVKQMISLNITSENSLKNLLTSLKKSAYKNNSQPAIECININTNLEKAYYISKNGIDYVNLMYPSFKSSNNRDKNYQLNHKVSILDFYVALLVSTHKFEWEEEQCFYDMSNKLICRNDASFIVNNNIYWIEQDMGTEKKSNFKIKCNNIATAIKYKYPAVLPTIIFSINLNYNKDIKQKLKSSFSNKTQKETESFLKIVKEINDMYKLFIAYDENISFHNFMSTLSKIPGHSKFSSYIKFLNDNKIKSVIDLENFNTAAKEIKHSSSTKRSELLCRIYSQRINSIKNYICSDTSFESLYYLMLHRGLDIFIERNDNINYLLSEQLLTQYPYKKLYIKNFIQALVPSYTQIDEYVQLHKTYNYATAASAALFKEVYSFSIENNTFFISAVDISINLGDEVRFKYLLNNYNSNTHGIFICIFDTLYEILDFHNNYVPSNYTSSRKFSHNGLFIIYALREDESMYTVENGELNELIYERNESKCV